MAAWLLLTTPDEERSGQMFAIGSRSPLFSSDLNAGVLVWPSGAF